MIRNYELGVLVLPELFDVCIPSSIKEFLLLKKKFFFLKIYININLYIYLKQKNEGNKVKLVNYYEKSKNKNSTNVKQIEIPIPFDLPLSPYHDANNSIITDPNTTSPWTWDVPRNELDLFGNKYCP